MNHNKWGEIATLLALGLVIVGTVITLATSLFVNNQKTNLASSPKAETQCAFADWDCAVKDCNGQAGCICGKMGKGFCSPGNCQAEGGTGNDVCVPNKWDGKGGWGCWGPAVGDVCAPQPSPSPSPGASSLGGVQNCTPGGGSFGNDGKYYCCFKAYEGPSTKLPYPHYEVIPSPPTTNCAVAAGTTVGTTGKTVSCEDYRSTNICQGNCPGDHQGWSCTGSICCPPEVTPTRTAPPVGATATPAPLPSTNALRACTDNDYTILDNSASICGADGWCGPKQKKYKMTAGTSCTPTSQSNSEFKCKNDPDCNSVPQATRCHEDYQGYCTDDGGCSKGETSTYQTNCGDSRSGRTCCIPPGNGTSSSSTTSSEKIVLSSTPNTVIPYQDSKISLNCYLININNVYLCTSEL